MAEDKTEYLSAEYLGLQPSSSSHSKPCKRSRTRPIKCLVLENCVWDHSYITSFYGGKIAVYIWYGILKRNMNW